MDGKMEVGRDGIELRVTAELTVKRDITLWYKQDKRRRVSGGNHLLEPLVGR